MLSILPQIGILGFGYLGQTIARWIDPDRQIWATVQSEDAHAAISERIQPVLFRWDEPETWQHIPERESLLVITIPPVLNEPGAEKDRLRSWLAWMHKHRPQIRRCIYISSTGVYPVLPGNWSETSVFEGDSVKGQLRLTTEQVLAEWLDSTAIRPGAIYGADRNIGVRILAGKPIPKGEQPVHRIHVIDLARLVLQLAASDRSIDRVNAVDLKAETTRSVAEWLVQQSFFPADSSAEIQYRSEFQTRKFNLSEPDRKISNQRLVEELKFSFRFPSYKEGLKDAFTSPDNSSEPAES